MQTDKLKHFVAGAFISGILIIFNILDPVAAALVGCLIGELKEAFDMVTKWGVPDVIDTIFTSAGSIVSAFLLWMFYL